MLEGRWRLLHKKCEFKLYNIKHVIIFCITLAFIKIILASPTGGWVYVEHLELVTS